jgi:outer membrane lipoprotein SlyB
MRGFFAAALMISGLAGCGPSYSPDTYAANAVQQANKVEQGVIVGVRDVAVSAAGTVGTLTGAAAGGIAGAQAGAGPVSAFTALGGSLVGGIAGSAVEHTTADTKAFEYIVRKAGGDLVSVTQKDKTPLALGQKVLVIAGNQARVVPDYTVPPPPPTATSPAPASSAAATAGMPSKPEAGPAPSADTKPVEPVKADTAPSNPALPGPVTNPGPANPATTPTAVPAASAPAPDAKPADTPGRAS